LTRASTAIRASSVGRAGAAVARAASAGARAVARVPGVRQIATAAEEGASLTGRALQAIEHTAENIGIKGGRALFTQGSRGAQAVGRFAETRNIGEFLIGHSGRLEGTRLFRATIYIREPATGQARLARQIQTTMKL
jgi:hypothetical protein